jgi:hypothetical protein
MFCFPGAAAAGPAPADFTYCSDVQGASKADSLYQVHLPEEVIRNSAPGLHDLRLFNSSGKETPFTIIENVPPYEETLETYSLEVTGYESGPASALITMKLPEKHRPVSVLDLDIADRDFRKRLVLAASRDGKTWQHLAEDSIYDFTSQVDLRKTRVEFKKTDARFFRIELAEVVQQPEAGQSIKLAYEGLEFSVLGAQKKNLRIRSVKGSTLVPAKKKPAYDRKKFTDITPALDKDGNTTIELAPALPVDQLSFDIKNHYYYRTVNIYGSATGKDDSFRLLASRAVYRFPLSPDQREEKNEIDTALPTCSHYKIVVLNKSNTPLDITAMTVSWVGKNLYFVAPANDGRYSLCYGNQRMIRPDYDIVRFVNRHTLSQFAPELAALADPVRKEGPSLTLRERIAGMEKPLLRIVVVLLVIGMGAWLFSLLKKRPEKK